MRAAEAAAAAAEAAASAAMSRLRLTLLVFEDREHQLGSWDGWGRAGGRLSAIWLEEMRLRFGRAVDVVVVEPVTIVAGDTPTGTGHRAHIAAHRRIRNLDPFSDSEPGDFWVVWVVGLRSNLGMALPLYRGRRPLRPGGIVILGAGNLVRPMRGTSDRNLRYSAWIGWHEIGHLMPQGKRDSGSLRYGLSHSSPNPFLEECIARHVMCYSPNEFADQSYVDGDGWDEAEHEAWERAPWLEEVPNMTRGWMEDVEHIPAIEQGYLDVPEGTVRPRAVISHIMQGYQSTMVRWAESPSNDGRSAHFSIGRAGRIVQHVGIFDAAWHAGRVESPTWPLYRGVNPNKETIGIEHEGFSVDPVDYPYDYLYSAERPWPPAMVAASVKVQRWIFAHPEVDMEPSSQTIIGHRETATRSRANDPGDQWPQQRIIEALSPAPPTPPVRVPAELSLRNARFPEIVDALRRRRGASFESLPSDDRHDDFLLRLRRKR